MISNNDVADAIAARIEETFAGETLYRAYKPSDFDRPSNLLEQVGGEMDANYACNQVEFSPVYRITTFAPIDAYRQSDPTVLTARQYTLAGIFLPGYLRVRDRAVKLLDPIKMASGLDFAELTVTLRYVVDRRELMDLVEAEPVGHIHIRTEVTSHG